MEEDQKDTPKSRPEGTGAKTPAAIRGTDSWPRLRDEEPVRIPSFDAVAWQSLAARAEVVLLGAKQRYSGSAANPVEMCKHVIRGMTPHVAAAVSAGGLGGEAAIRQMYVWVKEILKANTLVPLRWLAETQNPIVQKARDEFLFEEQIRPSVEWHEFVRAIADAGSDHRPAVHTQVTGQRTRKVRSSEVERRRGIVAGNLTRGPEDLCELFDQHGVSLPRDWAGNVQNWRQALRSRNYRQNVRQIISKDKHKVRKTTVKP